MLSEQERAEARRQIQAEIAKAGSVPPIRELAEQVGCPLTTTWRIVKELGWRADRRHRWKRKEKKA